MTVRRSGGSCYSLKLWLFFIGVKLSIDVISVLLSAIFKYKSV